MVYGRRHHLQHKSSTSAKEEEEKANLPSSWLFQPKQLYHVAATRLLPKMEWKTGMVVMYILTRKKTTRQLVLYVLHELRKISMHLLYLVVFDKHFPFDVMGLQSVRTCYELVVSFKI